MRKSKVLFSLIILVLFSLSFLLVSGVYDYGASVIQVTLMSQDPDPVEPGEIVTLKFKIENDGAMTSQDAIVRLLPKQPFSLYGDVAEKNIGKLRASSTGADAIVVEYKLKIDESAIEGESEIELEIQIGEAAIQFIDDEFTVDIETRDAILDIVSVTSTPSQIAPGKTAKVDIMVKNLADSLLKDIKFKLGLTDGDIPLAPYQSSSERRIAQLESNFQKTLTFDLIAEPDAVTGLYKVPLNITYNDEKGNDYQISDVLAIMVGEKPQIKAHIKKSTAMQTNKEGTLTLELANAGTTDVKFLELYILPSEDFELVSASDYSYLGDIDSDDTESEEIDIFIKRWRKTLSLPIKIEYYDANNQQYQQYFDLKMDLYSNSQLKKFGLVEPSKVGSYLLLLLMVITGIILYRKYKKDPKEFSIWLSDLKHRLSRRIPFRKKRK